jgi:hypothetical protein
MVTSGQVAQELIFGPLGTFLEIVIKCDDSIKEFSPSRIVS